MLMGIIVNLFIVSSWYVKGCNCFDPCPPNVEIIHICIDDKMMDFSPKIYMSTRLAPLQQAIECTCTIKGVSENYTLIVQGDSAKHDNNTEFSFAFDDVSIKNSTNFGYPTTVKLTGETILKYLSPNDDTVEVCLYIAAMTDLDIFNVECRTTSKTETTRVIQTSKNANSMKTKPTISSTPTERSRSAESTVMITKSQTSNNTTEDNKILIAAIVGAISGIILSIVVVVTIIYCRRKIKAMSNKGSQQTSSSMTYRVDDSGMQQNQAYESLNDVQPNQTPYDTLVVSQDTINDNTSPTLNYENMKVDITCKNVSADNSESYYNLPRHGAAQSEAFQNVVSVDKDTITYENAKVGATCHEENIDK